jgi:hypothetical protein
MFDELEQLREDARLATLLGQYARGDRETWLDRVMALDGVPPDALAKLHGKLLAQDWIEQNTGTTPSLRPGAVPQCYRATAAGQRALKKAQVRSADEDGDGP